MPIDGLWHNETITGVPVTLTAIHSDGTVTDLGKVTTNGYYGTFAYAWTPPDEGTYEIIASFESDESYGSSNAATAVTVGPAPASDVTPEPPTPEQPAHQIISTEAVIIVAVAVVAVVAIVAYWALRRRQ